MRSVGRTLPACCEDDTATASRLRPNQAAPAMTIVPGFWGQMVIPGSSLRRLICLVMPRERVGSTIYRVAENLGALLAELMQPIQVDMSDQLFYVCCIVGKQM